MSDTGSQRKAPTKKRKRVSPRKELAVVTFAAVASIAGVGGLLGMHQPVSQVAPPTPNVGATSWTSSANASRPTASHTLSQGSKAIVRTGRPANATQRSALVSRAFGQSTEEGEDS